MTPTKMYDIGDKVQVVVKRSNGLDWSDVGVVIDVIQEDEDMCVPVHYMVECVKCGTDWWHHCDVIDFKEV